jgi:hypothetical protein
MPVAPTPTVNTISPVPAVLAAFAAKLLPYPKSPIETSFEAPVTVEKVDGCNAVAASPVFVLTAAASAAISAAVTLVGVGLAPPSL